MAKPKHDKRRTASDVQSRAQAASMRVDPAHVIADGRIAAGESSASAAQAIAAAADAATMREVAQSACEATPDENSAYTAKGDAATPAAAAVLVQQVRTHATQLAGHLRRQQADLDHRESQLNARTAEMESQVRNARLWLQERQDELAQQKAALDAREQLLGGKATSAAAVDAQTREQIQRIRERDLAAAEGNWQEVCAKANRELTARAEQVDRRASELDERQTELDVRSGELDARELDVNLRQAQLDGAQQELAARAAQLAEQIAAGERAQQLQAELDQVTNRRQLLDDAEALVAVQQSDVARERHELAAKRDAMDELARAERKKLADLERDLRADLDKKRQALRRRTDDLDARRAALKQLRSEVARTQREVLEMRLATEELWAKLCGTMAPAALTQSLSQIRIKLADQNRLAAAELNEQKTELQELAAKVHDQHEKSARQKQELQDWMARRQQEIEEQAAHLVAREQQLDAQETEFGRRELAWQDERFGLQQEIRKLLRQLRRTDALAA